MGTGWSRSHELPAEYSGLTEAAFATSWPTGMAGTGEEPVVTDGLRGAFLAPPGGNGTSVSIAAPGRRACLS